MNGIPEFDVHEQADASAVVDNAPATAPRPALHEVVADIVRDSRRQPQRYLDEVVVPHGGE